MGLIKKNSAQSKKVLVNWREKFEEIIQQAAKRDKKMKKKQIQRLEA